MSCIKINVYETNPDKISNKSKELIKKSTKNSLEFFWTNDLAEEPHKLP